MAACVVCSPLVGGCRHGSPGFDVDLACPQAEPTPVIEDNSACIEWARDMVVSRKTRHFHVSYHLAKEHVILGTIRMHYAKTSDQLADIFTKALNAEVFDRHQHVLHNGLNCARCVLLISV